MYSPMVEKCFPIVVVSMSTHKFGFKKGRKQGFKYQNFEQNSTASYDGSVVKNVGL
jgi:hypothetical protein